MPLSMSCCAHLFKWPYHIDQPAFPSLTPVNFHRMPLLSVTDFPSAALSNECCKAAICTQTANNIAHSSAHLQPGSASLRIATIAPATRPASSLIA